MASSSKNIKCPDHDSIDHDSAEAGSVGQVIRPVVSRWLPKWAVSTFRAGGALEAAETHGVSELPVSNAPLTPNDDLASSADMDKRRTQAQEVARQLAAQLAQLEEDLARQGEKAQEVSASLERSIDQCERARERLSLGGEPVPESSTESLTMLQESFLNFSSAVKWHEKKHTRVLNNTVRLNAKLAALSERERLIQAELSQLDRDNNLDLDDFKQAA